MDDSTLAPPPLRISWFLVLDAMAAAHKDVRLAPLSNIVKMHRTKKGMTEVTIVVPDDVLGAIQRNLFAGGLLLADVVQFDAMQKEMEREARKAAEARHTPDEPDTPSPDLTDREMLEVTVIAMRGCGHHGSLVQEIEDFIAGVRVPEEEEEGDTP